MKGIFVKFGAIIIAIGTTIVFFTSSYKLFTNIWLVKKGVRTYAVVVDYKKVKNSDSDFLKYSFKYNVKGDVFILDLVPSFADWSLPLGSKILLFYDPEIPSRSVIDINSEKYGQYIFAIICEIFMLAGAILMFRKAVFIESLEDKYPPD